MHALLQVVASNSLVVVVFAVGVAALGWVWKRPAALHLLWVLVLVKFLTPPLVSVPLPLPGIESPHIAAHAASDAAVVQRQGHPSTALPSESDAVGGFGPSEPMLPGDVRGDAPPAALPAAASAVAYDPSNVTGDIAPPISAVPWTAWLLAIWGAGVFVLAATRARRIVCFRRLLRAAEAPSAAVVDTARRLAERLGLRHCPEVRMLRVCLSPLVWSLGGRACVVLPAELFERLDAAAQESILAHELAHVRRRDPWFRLLELIATTLFWWHPVAWWASLRLRELEEQCCDAVALAALGRDAKSYATALLDTLDFLSDRPLPAPLGATAANSPASLARRIALLKRGTASRRLTLGSASLTLLAAAIPMAVTLAAKSPQAIDDSPATSESETGVAVQTAVWLPAPIAETAQGETDQKTPATADNQTLRQILAAYKARESRVRSARFEWKETRTDPAMFEYMHVTRGLSPEAMRRVAMPPERAFDRLLKLSFQEGSVRFETQGPQWSDKLRTYAPRQYIATLDGDTSRSYFSGDLPERHAFDPHGFVDQKGVHPDGGTMIYRALSLVYPCGQPSEERFDPRSHIVAGYEMVNGRRCAVVQESENVTGRLDDRYWLDPDRDWVVVRMSHLFDAKSSIALDISFVLDEVHSWTPSGWKCTNINSGKAKTWFTATVTRYEINVPIPPSDFQPEFPVGTWVSDRMQNRDYIVREGDVRRVITREENESGASYYELSTTESGKAVPAEYTAMRERARRVGAASPQEQKQFVDALIEQARARAPSAWHPRRCVDLAHVAARSFAAAGQAERGVQMYRDLAEILPYEGRVLAGAAEQLGANDPRPSTAKPPSSAAAGTRPHGNDPFIAKVGEEPVKVFRGRVIDASGKPVAGAEIGMRVFVRGGHDLQAKSDAAGRFELAIPIAWLTETKPWSRFADVWAYAPGHQLGSGRLALSDEPAKATVQLGPPTDTAFVVLDPEGRPCADALVGPFYVRSAGGGYVVPPEALIARVSARTDAEGRVKLPAVAGELLYQVQVNKAPYGLQLQRTPPAKGPQTLRLRPAGKIEGRVIADPPELARGIRMAFTTEQHQDNEPPWLAGGYATIETDSRGRFVVPAIAAGSLMLEMAVDDKQPLQPRIPDRLRVEANQTTAIDIPLVPTVVVRGSMRVRDSGKPIAGALVSVGYGVGRQGASAVSDAEGRFTARVLPGPIGVQVIYMPQGYVEIEPFRGDRPYNVLEGAMEFELPPLEAALAKSISGRLLDQQGRPLANVSISARSGDPSSGRQHYGYGRSDADGRFTISRIPATLDLSKVKYGWTPEKGWLISAQPTDCEVIKTDPLTLRALPRDPKWDIR